MKGDGGGGWSMRDGTDRMNPLNPFTRVCTSLKKEVNPEFARLAFLVKKKPRGSSPIVIPSFNKNGYKAPKNESHHSDSN